MKEALDIFGAAFGLKVNYAKSSAIMIRSEAEDEELVKSALPWKIGAFRYKYLGLQPSIKQLRRSEWQSVVDMVLHILPGWQRGLVTRPGRLILVNIVMRARATRHLMIAEAPKRALERVDQGCRVFFWAGSEEVHRGKCVVSSRRVCRPKQLGGLRVIDLYKHGIALRLRWEWLRRTDRTRPWQGLNLVMDKKVTAAFKSLVKWQIGGGAQILLWKDRWCNGATINDIAPLVVARVRPQVRNKRSLLDALNSHDWASDIVGALCTEGLTQFITLWEILMDVQLDPEAEDKPIWAWNNNGTYTASSAYKMLCQGGIRFHSFSAIWKCWTPLACKIFMWLAVQYRLWTADRRVRHGLQDQTSACFLCDQEEDTVDHILLQCVFARQVWYLCMCRMHLDPVFALTLRIVWCHGGQRLGNVSIRDPGNVSMRLSCSSAGVYGSDAMVECLGAIPS